MWVFLGALVIFVLAVGVISYPLVLETVERFDERESDDEEYSERDALLEAMSELELSRDTGKISDVAYQEQKLRLQKQYLKTIGE